MHSSPSKRNSHRSTQRKQVRFAIESLEQRSYLSGWSALAHAAPAGIGTMMLLSDGTVMAQHSNSSNVWYRLTPDSTGSYQNGTWSTIAPMGTSRLYFTSSVLPDGRVFVLGGEYTGSNSTQNFSNTGQIYDPVANTWSTIANYPLSQYGDVPSALTSDGRVMAGSLTTAATYFYTPSTNTWVAGATKLSGDRSDEESWVKLGDNSVLSYNVFATGQGAQRYDPSTNTWIASGTVPVQLQTSGGYELGPAFRLQDGRAIFIGGTNHNAIYTPATTQGGTGSWVAAPDTPGGIGANDAPGAILPDGNVIYAAGDISTNFSAPTVIEEYNPSTNTIAAVPLTSGPNLSGTGAYTTRMLMLPNGQALFTSGGSSLYVYGEDAGVSSNSLRPSISGITSNGSGIFTVNGSQLGGISEGASYGDDAQMSTNFPVVRLTSATGVVTYARTFGWNNTGVAATAATSTNFTLPAGVTSGVYKMEVIGSGIASLPVLLTVVGSATGANATISVDPSNANNILVTTSLNSNSFPISQFTSAYYFGDANDNILTIHDGLGAFKINVSGGGGTDSLNVTSLTGLSGNWDIESSSISNSLSGLTVNYANDVESLLLTAGSAVDTVTVNGASASTPISINLGAGTDTLNVHTAAGSVSLLPSTGDDSVNVNANTGSANLNIVGTQRIGALDEESGGFVTEVGNDATLTVTSLAINYSDALDLGNNDLIVDYTGASPFSTINNYIKGGRNSGAWDGIGLRSSAAQANTLHNTSLGAEEATDYQSIYGTAATFDGQAIDSTAILVKYTYNGDTDFNGKIDSADYHQIDTGYQTQANAGFIDDWFNGDFDYNGTINSQDYALIDSAYQTQVAGMIPPSYVPAAKAPPVVRRAGGASGLVVARR